MDRALVARMFVAKFGTGSTVQDSIHSCVKMKDKTGHGKKKHRRRGHGTGEAQSEHAVSECANEATCELCTTSPSSARTHGTAHSSATASPDKFRSPRREVPDASVVAVFYCQNTRLYGQLHRQLQSSGNSEFTEESVSAIGSQVVAAVQDMMAMSGCSRGGKPARPGANPFVMLLSILIPTLRKVLAWTWTTRSVWYGATYPLSPYQHCPDFANSTARSNAASNTGGNRTVVGTPVVWAMIAQHDLLTRLTTTFAVVSRVIERSEEESDGQQSHHSDSLSTASTSTAPHAGSAADRHRIPQVHHIAVEFEDVYAEYRICLAELTECLVDNVETVRGSSSDRQYASPCGFLTGMPYSHRSRITSARHRKTR